MRALALCLVLAACSAEPKIAATPAPEPSPAATVPPFDAAAASALLTRVLQAQERNDPLGVQRDLFPRNSQTLNACAKTRLAFSRSASLIPDEGGSPSRITGVTLGSPRATANGYSADYKAVGNIAFEGTEHFIWADGRWWIKCQM